MGFLITQLRIGGSKRLLNFVLILALALIVHSDMVKSEKEIKSVQVKSACPAGCICDDSAPSVCIRCTDLGKNISTNCSKCSEPRFLISGKCIDFNCPYGCKCEGIIGWVCTGCVDQNADITTLCRTCSYGFSKNPYSGYCYPDTTPCPKNCTCDGKYPWICTRCNQVFLSLSSNCTRCSNGYFLNPSGICTLQRYYCPDNCFCDGSIPSNCTRCRDPYKNLSTGCRKCLAGYYLDRAGFCSTYCPPGCNCFDGLCVTCKNIRRNPSTACTTCLEGYTMLYGQCQEKCDPQLCLCIVGCVACLRSGYDPRTNCRCQYGFRINAFNQCSL